ncbi:toll/interleukin-1 receptor domain-containing protein [Sphingomonas lutea]|uniref:Toll/interleukin-1 receptor domain-containing protein n=1 Tax=Sphingomonas lutea TaxID=1045317 RepID=A0A7G9SI35_9SPHN|nr:toll/interleukin-1 receptor domain-containing protein [Sphingomonas lutea]
MASVFLSYDHEDVARATRIVSALENAGHSVWWDRHIHGGAEFQSEIEKAVEEADAVVVMWSGRSIKSTWVRDEAAEGRDAGKLIPVLIEPVKPPMGFRQFQTIDLSDRRRAAGPAQVDELLRAVAKMTATASSLRVAPKAPETGHRPARCSGWRGDHRRDRRMGVPEARGGGCTRQHRRAPVRQPEWRPAPSVFCRRHGRRNQEHANADWRPQGCGQHIVRRSSRG